MRIFKVIIVDVKDRRVDHWQFYDEFHCLYETPITAAFPPSGERVRPSCLSVRKQEGAQCFNAFRCMNETIVENRDVITQVSSDFIARGSNMQRIFKKIIIGNLFLYM